jgi:hypothetical protein
MYYDSQLFSFTILLQPQFTALKKPLQVILLYNFQNIQIKEAIDGNKMKRFLEQIGLMEVVGAKVLANPTEK